MVKNVLTAKCDRCSEEQLKIRAEIIKLEIFVNPPDEEKA